LTDEESHPRWGANRQWNGSESMSCVSRVHYTAEGIVCSSSCVRASTVDPLRMAPPPPPLEAPPTCVVYYYSPFCFFFTLDSVQETRWAPSSRGSIKSFCRLSRPPPPSFRLVHKYVRRIFFFPSFVPSGGIEVLSYSFIHRGVKEEWKRNTSGRLMSSPSSISES